MPQPFSIDLRTRIINACAAQELPQAEIADLFQVHQKTVEKYWKLWRTTQSVDPKPHAGGSAPRLAPHEADLRRWLQEQPDRTLDEMIQLVADHHQIRVSRALMSMTLTRLGLSRKKRRFTPASRAGPMWSRPVPHTRSRASN